MVKKIKKFIARFLKGVINFYNTWFGIINLILGFYLLSKVKTTAISVTIIVLMIIDVIRWFKGVFKNLATKSELIATVKQNNVCCIVGGIGSGKSTIGQYLLRELVPDNKQYFNTINTGYKAFTYKHLTLEHSLDNCCGVFCDEMGAMMDSFHYSKDDSPVRKRVELYNKFFRQFYGSNSYCFYIDQSQANMNTSLYKNVYYYIQCKSIEIKASSLPLYWIAELCLFWVNRKRTRKINNPFSNVNLTFMEFNVLGDYAEHYSVNIDEKNMKHLVVPIYKMFGTLDTYVFRQFNPAEKVTPYIWGTDSETDKLLMEQNFGLQSLKKKIKNTFINKE